MIDESGWTVDTLKEHIEDKMNDLGILLDERFATSTKALDAAFIAQQTAMATALTAAKLAVDTAQLAADKAVDKAEVASEKRYSTLADKNSDLQSRMDKNQGQDLGTAIDKTDKRLSTMLLISGLGLVLSFIAVGAAVIALFMK